MSLSCREFFQNSDNIVFGFIYEPLLLITAEINVSYFVLPCASITCGSVTDMHFSIPTPSNPPSPTQYLR